MKPSKKLITIRNNAHRISLLLQELVLEPRINAIKWSKITKQTPNMRIGYPGQHLASLITGIEGEKTGARGNDLLDGSEVKSCSRIDPLDKCNSCKAPVARIEATCSSCKSTNIARSNDSKWLFTIRNESDLDVLLHKVNRILLIISDYPNFKSNDFNTLRFQSFEIWPGHPRNKRFGEILTNYYYKIYLKHKKISAAKTPAPKNFWPYTYQFYMCNPILTFSCIVNNANTKPKIVSLKCIKPEQDRSKLPSEVMPTEILNEAEINHVLDKSGKAKLKLLSLKEKYNQFPRGIDEKTREILPLRDTDKISVAKTRYTRRKV